MTCHLRVKGLIFHHWWPAHSLLSMSTGSEFSMAGETLYVCLSLAGLDSLWVQTEQKRAPCKQRSPVCIGFLLHRWGDSGWGTAGLYLPFQEQLCCHTAGAPLCCSVSLLPFQPLRTGKNLLVAMMCPCAGAMGTAAGSWWAVWPSECMAVLLRAQLSQCQAWHLPNPPQCLHFSTPCQWATSWAMPLSGGVALWHQKWPQGLGQGLPK